MLFFTQLPKLHVIVNNSLHLLSLFTPFSTYAGGKVTTVSRNWRSIFRLPIALRRILYRRGLLPLSMRLYSEARVFSSPQRARAPAPGISLSNDPWTAFMICNNGRGFKTYAPANKNDDDCSLALALVEKPTLMIAAGCCWRRFEMFDLAGGAVRALISHTLHALILQGNNWQQRNYHLECYLSGKLLKRHNYHRIPSKLICKYLQVCLWSEEWSR